MKTDLAKTAIIWDEIDGDIKFFVLEGSMAEFEGIYINMGSSQEEVECSHRLSDVMYGEQGFLLHEPVSSEEFRQAIVLGAEVVRCGFAP